MIANGYTSKAAALRVLRDAGFAVSGLLSKADSNPKIAKNSKVGVMTSPLHLAPASLSGFNVCPQASEGCKAACLHTAGNPVYMDGKTRSRTVKTKAYFAKRDAFVAVLAFEIAALERKAKAAGMQAGVRLNATSDIAWERVSLTSRPHFHTSLMAMFPDVEFYDYTKVTKRALAAATGDPHWPTNYHLTFSKAEDNDADVLKVMQAGGNVSVVFSVPFYKSIMNGGGLTVWPNNADGVQRPVIDGDEHDFRPVDPKGCIVGLKAKGDAKGDTSGFVVR